MESPNTLSLDDDFSVSSHVAELLEKFMKVLGSQNATSYRKPSSTDVNALLKRKTRSKYRPHQGQQEIARRLRQIERNQSNRSERFMRF